MIEMVGEGAATFLTIAFVFCGVENWRAYISIFAVWMIGNVLLNVL